MILLVNSEGTSQTASTQSDLGLHQLHMTRNDFLRGWAHNIYILLFRFVKFLCEPDADRAANEMNNMELEGRNITVRRSQGGGSQKAKDGQGRRGKKSGSRSSEAGLYYFPCRTYGLGAIHSVIHSACFLAVHAKIYSYRCSAFFFFF